MKAIIEDYCERMYSIFVKEAKRHSRIPLNKLRFFRKPAYVIEMEESGRVNVYLY